MLFRSRREVIGGGTGDVARVLELPRGVLGEQALDFAGLRIAPEHEAPDLRLRQFADAQDHLRVFLQVAAARFERRAIAFVLPIVVVEAERLVRL